MWRNELRTIAAWSLAGPVSAAFMTARSGAHFPHFGGELIMHVFCVLLCTDRACICSCFTAGSGYAHVTPAG
jgi:hypothetical protein